MAADCNKDPALIADQCAQSCGYTLMQPQQPRGRALSTDSHRSSAREGLAIAYSPRGPAAALLVLPAELGTG